MRPREMVAAATVIAFLSSGCAELERSPASTPTTTRTPSSAENLPPPDRGGIDLVDVEVVRVDDGDSIRVLFEGSEERVRLLGINAPERDECLGDDSRQSLAELVGDVAVLGLEPDRRDQFGRLLAHVFAGDEYVNRHQVSAGLAIAYSDPNAFQDELIDAEELAERNRVGLWSAEACGGGPLPEALEIVRIEADPPGPDEDALDEEIVAITNDGDTSVDISGFVLRDESTANRFVFPEGTTVQPDETVEVVSGCNPPSGALAWCSNGPIWNNGGDSALLLDPSGRVIDHYRL